MRVLSKYIFREFIKLFILCQLIFLALYLIIDFIQKIDNFVEAGVSTGLMLAYFIYKIPNITVQMIPVATLISVIIMFCLMKKNNEIIAMRACGMDVLKLSQTIIIISIFIGAAIFFLSEMIVPYTSSNSNEIWDIEVEKQDPARFYGSNHIWYRSSDAIYWIKHFDSKKKSMLDPTFYFFDKTFSLTKRIDGKRAIWDNGVWRVEEGIIQKAEGDGGYGLTKFEELYLEIPETPDTFIRGVKSPEDMSYRQLRNYSEKVYLEGYDNTRYLVDMNIKIAFPFISLILTLIGIPIALWSREGGIPLSVAIGVGTSFLYMVALSFSRSLGLSGVLPPILSAWSANLIFLLFGIYLMMTVER